MKVVASRDLFNKRKRCYSFSISLFVTFQDFGLKGVEFRFRSWQKGFKKKKISNREVMLLVSTVLLLQLTMKDFNRI